MEQPKQAVRTSSKAATFVRDSWLMLGIAFLFLVLVEGVLALAFLLRDRAIAARQEPQFRVHADTYQDTTWVRDYYHEFHHSADVRWRPYVYWRRKPYIGRYINVDTSGIRRTVAPMAHRDSSARTLKVFMFGGSTIWGTGARDAFTIPSLLARELSDRGMAVDVVNFGESGYVTTQEVIALMVELQKGRVPDLVIFYDGINDTFSAHQQRTAGLPQNEFNREREFNLTIREGAAVLAARNLAKSLSTTRFLLGVLRRAGTGDDTSSDSLSTREVESLAHDVIATYRANVELVRALGRQHDFQALFYWQPNLFEKARLTEYEKKVRTEMIGVEPLFRRTYALIRENGLGASAIDFHDVSLAFASVSEPMYVDWIHLGETGNLIIAQRMAKDVLGMMGTGNVRVLRRAPERR